MIFKKIILSDFMLAFCCALSVVEYSFFKTPVECYIICDFKLSKVNKYSLYIFCLHSANFIRKIK